MLQRRPRAAVPCPCDLMHACDVLRVHGTWVLRCVRCAARPCVSVCGEYSVCLSHYLTYLFMPAHRARTLHTHTYYFHGRLHACPMSHLARAPRPRREGRPEPARACGDSRDSTRAVCGFCALSAPAPVRAGRCACPRCAFGVGRSRSRALCAGYTTHTTHKHKKTLFASTRAAFCEKTATNTAQPTRAVCRRAPAKSMC